MASAHGAGIVLPLALGRTVTSQHGHTVALASSIAPADAEWSGPLAALTHSAGYLLMTGAIAVLVYERIGLGFLRRGWINLDLVWAIALVITGLASLALGSG
jgi:hypothetical protein